MVSAKKQMPKFSAGVNFKAISARDGAQKNNKGKNGT